MTTGFIASNGIDLDSLFFAGAGGAATGYKVNGADLNTRFAQRIAAPIANTGFLVAGVDLAQRFEPIGAGLNVQLQAGNYVRADSGTPASISWNAAGTFTRGAGVVGGTNYNWLISGAANQVEIFVNPTLGAFSSGAVGVWTNLGVTQTYTRAGPAGTITTVEFTVQLRNASTLAILAGPVACKLSVDRT